MATSCVRADLLAAQPIMAVETTKAVRKSGYGPD